MTAERSRIEIEVLKECKTRYMAGKVNYDNDDKILIIQTDWQRNYMNQQTRIEVHSPISHFMHPRSATYLFLASFMQLGIKSRKIENK